MDIDELRTMHVWQREAHSLTCLRTLLQCTARDEPLSVTGEDSVIFVVIDFEYDSKILNGTTTSKIKQIGISTFDTNDLSRPVSDLEGVLKSQNHQWAKAHRSDKYLFGESKRVFPHEMRGLLEENILVKDDTGKLRRIVLVTHDTRELKLMKDIGFDPLDKKHGLLGYLDTTLLGSAVLCEHHIEKLNEPGKNVPSLKTILKALEIPFHHLHVAGNDAHFTAKALLMLAVRGTRNAGTKLNEDQEEMMAKLEVIGKASIDAELSRPTPDIERFQRKALAYNNEKRNVRLEARKVDLLDYFSGFAELEI